LIRRLRDKRRVDRLRNEGRAVRPQAGRWIYLLLLFGFFLWLADLVIGPYLRLEAKGLVLAELVSVGVPFAAEVEELSVAPGAAVRRGDPLARVSSVDRVLDIATLTARNAELLTKRAEIERRVRIAQAVLPIARERALEADRALEQIRDVRTGGHVSLATWSQALAERFVASERVAELQAEARVADAGLAAVDSALADAMQALATLNRAYGDGLVAAPRDGMVGLNIARPGSVLTVGQPLMMLYPPERYVLAYLETGTLYSVAPGDRVRLTDGFVQSTGRISEVLPVAEQLPEEFRKIFQPRDRSQVARISLDDAGAFPLFAKVTVSGIGWLSPGSAIRSGVERVFRDTPAPIEAASELDAATTASGGPRGRSPSDPPGD
jgi:multidrug resistance efflux pump